MPDAMSAKQMFLETFSREHATTLKVLRAFPAAECEFKPHERSQTARKLAWTFVMEQALIHKALTNTMDFGAGMPKAPDDMGVIIDQFDREFNALVDLIKKTPDDKFASGMTKFFTGPGKLGDLPIPAFCWFMLYDQIHHRGQLSVYIRMAGGKVPAIYGPSADEPWN